MEIYFQGVILAVCTFFIIGLLHPVVVKWEFYFGTKTSEKGRKRVVPNEP